MDRERILKMNLDEQLQCFNRLLSESGQIPDQVVDLYQRAIVLKLDNSERLNYFNRILETGGAIPEYLADLHKMAERSHKHIQIGVEMERLKTEWASEIPDFRIIYDKMISFQTTSVLIEFRRKFPGKSISDHVLSIYKKCISYRQKLTKKIQNNLAFGANTPQRYYERAKYCIDPDIVYSFLQSFLSWRSELYPYWNKVFNEVSLYRDVSEFHLDYWKDLVRFRNQLAKKSQYIEALHDDVLRLIEDGSKLLQQLDHQISEEYERSKTEMSLYHREMELDLIADDCSVSDKTHCYVYTLECEFGVFYVGLAADPKERLEQHIRGAFSDESHLFKSKFIQKYRKSIKQRIIYEGKRKDCKIFEREYIEKHQPLGNMTEGGEG